MAQKIRYYTQGEDDRELPELQTPAESVTLPTAPATGAADPPAPSYDDSTRQRQRQLLGAYTGRGAFQYDPSNDPMYKIYRDRYVQNARLGMRDTMGQAAALTGGYGSSYAQGVGQQRYDETMRGLTDKIPELYQAAYARYQDEGDRLLKQYQLLGEQADREYSQYRDALGDWQTERAWQAQQDESAYGRSQDAYSRLYALIAGTGYQATPEELQAAGLSQEAADALRNEFYRSRGLPVPGAEAAATTQYVYVPQDGETKYTLEDALQDAQSVKHSNQREEIFRTYQQAIANGQTNFTLAQLQALWTKNHW
ncbi:MAG: hypothetical protein IK095_03315 [Oscillospiraceae bacterium]|nr:hypothetical protein [Oscillospiraceae bacterium]